MKKTVTLHDFVCAFHAISRGEQFSRSALNALFDHIESYEAETGEEVELDVIALCCEFVEYKTAAEAALDYSGFEDDGTEESAMDWLQDQTTVIEFDGGIIVQAF